MRFRNGAVAFAYVSTLLLRHVDAGRVRLEDTVDQWLPDLPNADRAEGTRLADVQLAFLRGVHHQRDGRGQRVSLDGLHGLEPIHARHQVIHEDDVGSAPLQVFECLLSRLGRIHGHALLFEHPAQDDSGRS